MPPLKNQGGQKHLLNFFYFIVSLLSNKKFKEKLFQLTNFLSPCPAHKIFEVPTIAPVAEQTSRGPLFKILTVALSKI